MIDQRFLDDLAQDLQIPDENQEEMQLASANTGVTTDGGAFVGYRMNMPKGLNTRENQAKQSVLIADTMAGGGKGAVQGFVGLPGDLESIGRMALGYLGYNVDENTVLPTSEEIGKRLESVLGPVIPPNQTTGVPTEERVRAAGGGELGGEILSPGGQIALASKVAKPVIGATKKIIKAGKDLPVGMSIKGVDESLDPLGFYSAASKAVDSIAQEKGTGAQFLAQIEKTPGVKKEELLWTGLDDFLKGKKSVTKAEVQEYLSRNRVEVKEVTLGQNNPYPYRSVDEWQNAISRAERAGNFDEAERLSLAWESAEGIGPAGTTKFAKYTLPGGENYREVLLTLPTKMVSEDEARVILNAQPNAKLSEADIAYASRKQDVQFRSQHFDQPNVLAHMRLNDRVDADGKKVLFVEEIQSDWHQAGRKKGYASAAKPFEVFDPKDGKPIATFATEKEAKEYADKLGPQVDYAKSEGVPDAPFKTSWHELSLKRAIQLASEGGYDRIAFTTGKTQAERYDLSKQIENIQYNQKTKSLFGEDKNGRIVVDEIVEPEKLDEYIGKEAANKLLSDESIIARTKDGKPFLHELSGQQLQVGGEGMKGFYDTILPKYLDKYGKKWDAKTGMTKIRLASDAEDAADSKLLKDLGMDEGGQAAASVHYMDITPKMKESVLTKGQPLFQMAPAIPAGAAATQMQEENK